ncbi:MAG: GAF domain-containing protein [Proteobacteria bacterium]|nr:GAF domain-containing protein [Pseudomonadota bacterium]
MRPVTTPDPKNLLRSLKSHRRLLRTLNEASRVPGMGQLEKNRAISRLLKALQEIIGGDSSWVAIRNEKSGEVIYPCHYQLPIPIKQLKKIPPQLGITRRVIVKGRPIFVADYPSHREAIPEIVRAGVKQFLGLPLKYQGRTFGMVGVCRLTPGNQPRPEQIASAETLGNILALVLGGTHLIQEEQKQKNELRVLREVTLHISSEQDLDRIYTLVIRRGMELLKLEAGAVEIWNAEKKGFVTTRNVNMPPRLENLFIPAGTGMTNLIIKTGKPVALSNYQKLRGAFPEIKQLGLTGMIGAPIRAGGSIFGILILGTRRPGRNFSRAEKHLIELLAEHASVAVQSAQFRKAQKEYETRLRQLSGGIISAQEEERKRIARELHDEHGQAVSLIKIRLDHLSRNWGKKLPPPVRRELAEINRLLSQNIQDIRRLIAALRPSMLDDLGLIPTLRWWLSRFENETGISTDLSLPRKWDRIPDQARTIVYRIIQESLTNTARHSAATRVKVTLKKRNGHLLAEIEDNGIGFRVEKVMSRPSESIGLMGIEERVALLGGKTEIKSQPGKGTRIRVELPLPGFSS